MQWTKAPLLFRAKKSINSFVSLSHITCCLVPNPSFLSYLMLRAFPLNLLENLLDGHQHFALA